PVEVLRAPVDAILALREEYRREMRCQIVHDSYHARGFTDSYLLRMDGQTVGYGSVAGDPEGPRETIKEFFVLPDFRRAALPLFRALATASKARWIDAQTNDRLLSLMLFDCARELVSETILFSDGNATSLTPGEAVLRPVTEADRATVFPHAREPVGAWGLEVHGAIVATGGLLLHYNPPYADIHMEVASRHRRRGYGSYLVQELKRLCAERGLIPAARCRADNVASRRTLERAGMLPCARIVRGRLAGCEG
ncbi:MAG: GNAT family N-acetyltransferase, partial [Gemmatimonadales bacterium]